MSFRRLGQAVPGAVSAATVATVDRPLRGAPLGPKASVCTVTECDLLMLRLQGLARLVGSVSVQSPLVPPVQDSERWQMQFGRQTSAVPTHCKLIENATTV